MPRAAKTSAVMPSLTDPLVRRLSAILMQDNGPVPPAVVQWVCRTLSVPPTPTQVVLSEIEERSWLLVHAPDQPFLTDTVSMTLRRQGVDVGGLWHPVLKTERDGHGKPLQVVAAHGGHASHRESLILARLAQHPSTAADTVNAVKLALETAKTVVSDFEPMVATLHHARNTLAARGGASDDELALLEWMASGQMILLGSRHYDYRGAKAATVQVTAGSGLGLLRDDRTSQAAREISVKQVGTLAHYVSEPGMVIVSKTPDRSPVHRDAAMDFVSVLERDAKGTVVGEQRFVGLWTSRAYTRPVDEIPLVRAKVEQVKLRSNYPTNSLRARMLINVLDTWPRDELFLTSAEDLQRLAEAVVAVRERPDVRVLVRRSPRERAVTVQVFIPISRYSSSIRQQVMPLLANTFGGVVQDFRLELGDGELARLVVRLAVSETTRGDEAVLEEDIRQLVRGWEDEVKSLDQRLWTSFGAGSSLAYREQTTPAQALEDFRQLQSGSLGLHAAAQDQAVTLRLVSVGAGYPLHKLVPLLDAAGLLVTQEQAFRLTGGVVQMLQTVSPAAVDAKRLPELERLVTDGLQGGEIDELNRLVLQAGLTVGNVFVLRALVAYAQQVDRGFEPNRSRALLLAYPALATGLVTLFAARLGPTANERNAGRLEKELRQLVHGLPTTAQERLGRTLLETVTAALRTNAWQRGANDALALKLDSHAITALPQPRPWREIFVYHSDVEGVHLRGGPVARGGLRHSDRQTDYRTEILGLMVAQTRKNTIIVPVGAKGGFYVKVPLPGDRAAAGEVIVANYRRYISALLSISDTYDAKRRVVAPRNVHRRDGDDPYLVVAADKGTAKFSDTANSVAEAADYWDGVKGGFWLGDAFASGGSQGYDHKGMGITARGAWVSVVHHLKALGIAPTPKRPLAMAGVGDMAGDVFGNGVLLEPNAQLVAAFNHMHIFLDPNPDPAKSFAERQRCFKAGLGWDGYDGKVISAGGGIWPRTVKTIPLSAAMRARLGIKKSEASPDEVASAILKAPVDVLWNGGIGTFIKASDEPHTAAADKANDALRVDGDQVRAKVIGEGGNLGITPRGRVEMAKRGVRLNTDALDNSAGVDTSDHEVNLKILFQAAKSAGKMDEAARRKLLQALTDDVAEAVLTDNRLQNLALTLEQQSSPTEQRELQAWQQELLRRGVVDMVVDYLPTPQQLSQRPDSAYTRPELAALLAGTKATLRTQLLRPEAEDILLCPLVRPLLKDYFPAKVQKSYGELIERHALANELTATALANLLVNRLGLLFGPRLAGDFSAQPLDAVRAAVLAVGMMDAHPLWDALDANETRLEFATLTQAHLRLRQVAYGLAAWVLRHGQPVRLGQWQKLLPAFNEATKLLPETLSQSAKTEAQTFATEWQKRGMDAGLAARLSQLSPLAVVPDAVLLAQETKRPVKDVLKLHLALGEALQLPKVIRKVRQIAVPDSWSRQAVQAMTQELFLRQRVLSAALLRQNGAGKNALGDWSGEQTEALSRYGQLVSELMRQTQPSVAMLNVLLGRLRELD